MDVTDFLIIIGEQTVMIALLKKQLADLQAEKASIQPDSPPKDTQ